MKCIKEKTDIEQKYLELFAPAVKAEGYEIYDLDFISGNTTARLFIQNPETKTAVIEDCVKIDRALTPCIEGEDWIPDSFILEVSSPGVYRQLNSLEHFQGQIGKRVTLQLTQKFETQEQKLKEYKHQYKLTGDLLAANDSQVTLKVNGIEVNVPFEQLKKAKLDPEF